MGLRAGDPGLDVGTRAPILAREAEAKKRGGGSSERDDRNMTQTGLQSWYKLCTTDGVVQNDPGGTV